MKMWQTVKNVQTESSNRKKRVKKSLTVIWLIIWFLVLWLLNIYWMYYSINKNFLSGTFFIFIIGWIFSILIALYLEILIIYLILLWRTRKIWWKDKTKKHLKISLIVISPFLLLSIFAFFTKGGTIPNRFDIDLLSPERVYLPRDLDWNIGWCYDNPNIPWQRDCFDKPIIYLYPTVETEINVRLWTLETLSHTYPKYNSEKWWNVIAQPNWDLEDMDTWRKLYALYREWKSDKETNFSEWFVVAWKDIIPFLEEKLAILWLNEREAEEFIVYWLPQMENNKYNLIRFETIEEQNENMPLNVTPTPDIVIRVMMDWKAIDEPIDIPEQQLIALERNWFTVVEWWWSHRS